MTDFFKQKKISIFVKMETVIKMEKTAKIKIASVETKTETEIMDDINSNNTST